MRRRVFLSPLACLVILVAASCATSEAWLERGRPARDAGVPVLVGTLVDGDGRALPRLEATVNFWSEGFVCSGGQVVTDHEGRFRLELSSSFVERSSEKRNVGLVASERVLAMLDARRAFAPGVHDIGDLLLADPADPRALTRLSDDLLLSRLELLRRWGCEAFDACLRECARRGGPEIIDRLDEMERSDRGYTDTSLVTARNRAARLADPLVLELPDGAEAPIVCHYNDLPVVRLAFVNRDPLRRTLRLSFAEPPCQDLSLAVDGHAVAPAEGGIHLVRRSFGGGRTIKSYKLAPGEELVLPVPLGDYVKILSGGRYSLRFAFRSDANWELDDGAKELPIGVLFLYSKPFVLEVSSTSVRS